MVKEINPAEVNPEEYVEVNYISESGYLHLLFLKDLEDPEMDYAVSKAMIEMVKEYLDQESVPKPVKLLVDIQALTKQSPTSPESNALFRDFLQSDLIEKAAMVGLSALESLVAKFVISLGKTYGTKVAIFATEAEAIAWLSSK